MENVEFVRQRRTNYEKWAFLRITICTIRLYSPSSLDFGLYYLLNMTTDEILKKLESLLELQRKAEMDGSGCKYDTLFDFQRENGWPIVTELQTPLGELTVLDKDNNKIPFLVSYNSWFCERLRPEDVFNEDYEKVLDNVSAMLTIQVDVNNLKECEVYRVNVSGEKLEHADGDQYAECYTKEKDNELLAINRPVENDFDDLIELESLIESNFDNKYWKQSRRFVTFDADDMCGFLFVLKDRTWPCFYFDIAWMYTEKLGKDLCWDALTFYLT